MDAARSVTATFDSYTTLTFQLTLPPPPPKPTGEALAWVTIDRVVVCEVTNVEATTCAVPVRTGSVVEIYAGTPTIGGSPAFRNCDVHSKEEPCTETVDEPKVIDVDLRR
jgi:hypothetical protein